MKPPLYNVYITCPYSDGSTRMDLKVEYAERLYRTPQFVPADVEESRVLRLGSSQNPKSKAKPNPSDGKGSTQTLRQGRIMLTAPPLN